MHNYREKLIERGQEVIRYKNHLIRSLKINNKQVLDLGCSIGIYDQEIIIKNHFWGVDRDDKALAIAKNKGYQTVIHDLHTKEPLPFNDSSFDLIIALDLLEHLVNPNILVKEIHRLLKPDGIFYVGVPNGLNIINRISFCLGNPRDITDMQHFEDGIFSDHLHHFSLSRFECFLANNSFDIKTRHFFLPKKIRHQSLRFLSGVLFLLNLIKINIWWPTLFSFAFIYFCTKNDDNKMKHKKSIL